MEEGVTAEDEEGGGIHSDTGFFSGDAKRHVATASRGRGYELGGFTQKLMKLEGGFTGWT